MADFENLPNFRQAGGSGLTTVDSATLRDGLMYRSSRTDFVTCKDVTLFRERLGIKTIIDLRRLEEYNAADGEKLLNSLYEPCIVHNGVRKKLHAHHCAGNDDELLGTRYIISMTSKKLIWHLFNKIHFLVRWFTLLIALFDWIFGTHYFVKIFNHYVLNHQTMSQRYLEVLEFCKDSVRDCVRIVCEESSLPVLIHCAHGKDRTGLLVALLLSAVGVKDEDIVKDYAKSEVKWPFHRYNCCDVCSFVLLCS